MCSCLAFGRQATTGVAYAKVTLNVVDVITSEVIYSVQRRRRVCVEQSRGARLRRRGQLRSTLNGKVLDLAVREGGQPAGEGLEQEKGNRSRNSDEGFGFTVGAGGGSAAHGVFGLTIYSWGHYQPLVYTMYAQPGKATPEMQVLALEEDFQKPAPRTNPSRPDSMRISAIFIISSGNGAGPASSSKRRKATFPESAVFMDRLLANLNKP